MTMLVTAVFNLAYYMSFNNPHVITHPWNQSQKNVVYHIVQS